MSDIALTHLGRPIDALGAFEQALHLDPFNVVAYAGKGAVIAQLGRYVDALEAQEQVLRLDPTIAIAYHHKGNLLKALGRLQEAGQAFAKARELGYHG